VPDLALRRLRPVLDLGQQRWLDPDAPVSDLPGVGLGLADQRRQALAKLRNRGLVEAVVHLTCIDEFLALKAAQVDAIPVVAVERKPRDGQGFALGTGFLDPVI
jgi:hypothetical protein